MKTALVTGANDGIGLETAKQLLHLGFKVLLHARSQAKAEALAEKLALQGSVAPVWGDLSEMGQVRELAGQVSGKLDVLINNAGVYELKRRLTRDGFELTMAVNHFSHMLLTLLLEKQVRGGRVVTVSSVAHQSGHIDLTDLAFERRFDGYLAYAASKLANVLFAARLAREWPDTLSFSLHPGVISTKLLHKGFGMGGAPVELGAKTSVHCASAPGLEKFNGGYFVDARPSAASAEGRDMKLQDQFWEKSLERIQPS